MASMPLFFVTRESILQDRIDITGTDAAHIVRVLRLRKGAKLLISETNILPPLRTRIRSV